MVEFYRYFFAFRPPPALARHIVVEARRLCICITPDELTQLHVTLCVIAEWPWRDRTIANDIDAVLSGAELASCKVSLGRLKTGPEMAILQATGKQADIRGFFERLLGAVQLCGLAPFYRKSGLNAHITLKHGYFERSSTLLPVEWYPHELLLIESWVGEGKHVVISRWPLQPPAQSEFGFMQDGLYGWRN